MMWHAATHEGRETVYSNRLRHCRYVQVRMATPAKKLKMDMDVLARSIMTVYVCHNVNSIRIKYT